MEMVMIVSTAIIAHQPVSPSLIQVSGPPITLLIHPTLVSDVAPAGDDPVDSLQRGVIIQSWRPPARVSQHLQLEQVYNL